MARDFEGCAAAAAEGLSSYEIAERLGVSKTTICRWLRRDDVQEMVRKYEGAHQDKLMRRLRALAPKAVEVLEQILDGDWPSDSVPPSVALRAAQWRLDRAWPLDLPVTIDEQPQTMTFVLEGMPRPPDPDDGGED